ncbi:unnamed protein product [Rhizophagus irregularis]|nr:unnamed protein product [Rhizophagus irregularis]
MNFNSLIYLFGIFPAKHQNISDFQGQNVYEPNTRPSVLNKSEEMNKNSGSELINSIIKNKLVKVIDKSDLLDMKNIDEGHFGIISKAIWKKTNNYVICKRLKNNDSVCNKPIEAFLHLLEMHRRLDFCQRVIRILGINLDESTKEILLIMQYADSGNLRQYLEQTFLELTWNDKIKLAYQITEGIKFLQGENILHRNLHSKNIVIHRGEAKIIGLTIAKRVLMWELSSGYPPFAHKNFSDVLLRFDLINGYREEPIPVTPNEYLKLYKLCWDGDPNVRPTIYEVFNTLVRLGRMRDIQGFQDIRYEDIDMQGIQDVQDVHQDVQDNQDSDYSTDLQGDDNDDLDIPDDVV